MSKFIGVEPLGSLIRLIFRQFLTGVNALLQFSVNLSTLNKHQSEFMHQHYLNCLVQCRDLTPFATPPLLSPLPLIGGEGKGEGEIPSLRET